MEQLTQKERRDRNADKLKQTDLWITGDGTPFPPTTDGMEFARKWARKNGLSLHYEKKQTPTKSGATGNSKSVKKK